MTWPPPKKKDWQIKHGAKQGGWVVRCRHGNEHADVLWFALVLYDAAWNKKPESEEASR